MAMIRDGFFTVKGRGPTAIDLHVNDVMNCLICRESAPSLYNLTKSVPDRFFSYAF